MWFPPPMTRTERVAKPLESTRNGHRRVLSLGQTRTYMQEMFGDEVHSARVLSLANGVAGVLDAASLSIHAIGQAYAKLAKTTPKAGVKQVDRLLSNTGIKVDELLPSWAKFVVGERKEIMLAMDWTDFDDDDHTTLAVYLLTNHGRATPLAWKTTTKSDLAGRRTALEHEMVERIQGWLPTEVSIVLLADRGFGDQALYALLEGFGWDYVIRFRGNIVVEAGDGEIRTAAEWVPKGGRALKLVDARVTRERHAVPAVVVVHDRKMKESWCLATSLKDERASAIVKKYGKRFTIEETFRDTKDIHFGMGLSATHIARADRRDRLLFLAAIAHALLTLLGAASEAAGLDRILKVNTVKKRTHSLYRQGLYWYDALLDMREEWLSDLMREFDRIVRSHAVFCEILGVI